MPQPEYPDIDAALDRALAGLATPPDEAVLRAWAASHGATTEEQGRLLRGDVFGRDSMGTLMWDDVTPRMMADAAAIPSPQMATGIEATTPKHVGRAFGVRGAGAQTRWDVRRWVWGVGAIAVVLVAGWGIGVRHGRNAGVSDLDGSHARTYVTGTGQRAVLTLGDGTRVTLAPQTTLRVTALDTRARTVALDGEAYFTVAPSAGAPFVVRTGRVQTRVLGTAFWVRHYAVDPRVQVAVATGKVAVTAETPQHPSILLAAGMAGEVTGTSATVMATGDVARHAGWLEDKLVFHDTPVPEVLGTLERWYGYHFRLGNPALAGGTLTAVLSTDSVAATLSTLKLLLDVDLTIDGQVVTLTPRRARAAPPRYTPQQSYTIHKSEVGR